MRFLKVASIFFAVTFFLSPSFFASASESPQNLNSICDVVMAHDSLTAEFPSLPNITIKAGDSFVSKINIKNKTVHTYKNTRLLYKVFYVGEKESRIVDFGILQDKYDVVGGTENMVDISWKSDELLVSGTYYMEVYVIQNGVHVIGDFARDFSAKSSITFNINGRQAEAPVKIESDKTLIGGVPYAREKMLLFGKEDTDDTAKFTLKNTSKEKQEVVLNWKVYSYGLFEEKDILLSTSTFFIIEPNKEYQANLNIPLVPSNRYHAILDIENNGLHTVDIFRWARGLPAPSSLDNYGIVKSGDFLSSTEMPKDFGLQKGKTYNAFACIVGGYEKNNVTVSMRLRDENDNVIFSMEETKVASTETAKFEYQFIPTRFSKNMHLDIVVMNGDSETRVWWKSDCGLNKEGVCKNDSFLPKIKTIYLISILIIVVLFLIPRFLGVKR